MTIHPRQPRDLMLALVATQAPTEQPLTLEALAARLPNLRDRLKAANARLHGNRGPRRGT